LQVSDRALDIDEVLCSKDIFNAWMDSEVEKLQHLDEDEDVVEKW
jgi:hypothetical protein